MVLFCSSSVLWVRLWQSVPYAFWKVQLLQRDTLEKRLLEYSCFTMVWQFLLFNKNKSAVHIHISPLFLISFPFKSLQSIEQSPLCYTVVIFFLVHSINSVYMLTPISQFIPSHLPPLVSVCFVLHVCVSISV